MTTQEYKQIAEAIERCKEKIIRSFEKQDHELKTIFANTEHTQ